MALPLETKVGLLHVTKKTEVKSRLLSNSPPKIEPLLADFFELRGSHYRNSPSSEIGVEIIRHGEPNGYIDYLQISLLDMYKSVVHRSSDKDTFMRKTEVISEHLKTVDSVDLREIVNEVIQRFIGIVSRDNEESQKDSNSLLEKIQYMAPLIEVDGDITEKGVAQVYMKSQKILEKIKKQGIEKVLCLYSPQKRAKSSAEIFLQECARFNLNVLGMECPEIGSFDYESVFSDSPSDLYSMISRKRNGDKELQKDHEVKDFLEKRIRGQVAVILSVFLRMASAISTDTKYKVVVFSHVETINAITDLVFGLTQKVDYSKGIELIFGKEKRQGIPHPLINTSLKNEEGHIVASRKLYERRNTNGYEVGFFDQRLDP